MQFSAAQFGYTGTGQHHDIHTTEFMLQETEAFPGCAFDEIAGDGTVCVLLGDGQTEAWVFKLVASGQHGETTDRCPSRLRENALIILRLGQPCAPGKARRYHSAAVRRSGAKTRTPFGAPCFEYQAAVLGGHARAKAVRAGAVQVAGLKGSLHDGDPIYRRVSGIRFPNRGHPLRKRRVAYLEWHCIVNKIGRYRVSLPSPGLYLLFASSLANSLPGLNPKSRAEP